MTIEQFRYMLQFHNNRIAYEKLMEKNGYYMKLSDYGYLNVQDGYVILTEKAQKLIQDVEKVILS